MRKRIFTILMLCCTLITIATAVLVAFIYYNFYTENTKSEIQTETSLIANALNENTDTISQLRSYAEKLPTGIRITLVDFTGVVLFDTDTRPEILDNHAQREEIASAIKRGTGDAIRFSDTLNKDSYYYALRLASGSILRLSSPLDSMFSVFGKTIPFLILIVLSILAFAFALSSRLTKRALAPVNMAAMRLDDLLKNEDLEWDAEYDELIPFIRKIKALNLEIKAFIQTLQAKQDTITAIIQNMQEGLILLDGNNRIITISKSAVSLLAANQTVDYSGRNVLELIRSQKLLEAIHETHSSDFGASFMEKKDGRFYKYFISPAQTNGTIIFIVDATSEVRAETMRRDFASNVSHELKTPITSIVGFTELLETGMIAGEDIKNTATIMHREAKRLIALIDDILRLSQIENAAGQAEFESVRLGTLAEATKASLQSAATAKNVTVELSVEDVSVHGRESMLHELLYNLLDNAIKYNIEGGHVLIHISQEETHAVISVSDTGIGIPAQHLERIFERFYRVDQSRSKATGGTGLGLSIVKHVVEYHNGTIAVETTENAGTTITISLPL